MKVEKIMAKNNNLLSIKTVGSNGQISLGKKYAGQQVQISELGEGTILIKSGRFIPDNEMWLYQGDNLVILDQAIKWAESTERKDNFESIIKMIEPDHDSDYK